MIPRSAAQTLARLARQYKAVAVIGPRQSGKTTLTKLLFPEKAYVNFENPDTRLFATEDPRGFLSNYPNGAIFDEAQRVPELFSYLQQILDESTDNGLFIITGSNNFLLQQSISQSLAGRVAYLTLLPLSLDEIGAHTMSCSELLFKGSYPSLYQQEKDISNWYANYIRTYVERDVRLIKNITNLATFERFIRLCAGRIGQLLNVNSLALEVGVDNKTINAWIGVLESTFVAFRLQPYHQNFNKRIVKMSKFYFYDTGLAAHLLGIDSSEQLDLHVSKGALFENLIIVDLIKRRFNEAKRNNLFFWRDSAGNELDVLIEQASGLIPIEIKSGQTITSQYFKGLNYWQKITGSEGGYVVYAGKTIEKRSKQQMVLPFTALENIKDQFFKPMKTPQQLLENFTVIASDLTRPWGGFYVIDETQAQAFSDTFFEGLDVSTLTIGGKLSPKILLVSPEQRLSWQYHNRRAEIWRVVEGPVGVVRSHDDQEGELVVHQVGEYIKLAQGERHRLIGLDSQAIIAEIWQHTDATNPSNEDDIVRVQDDFGR